MGRGLAERRHQKNRAKAREERKHRSGRLANVTGKDRRIMVGKLSVHRTQCSCGICTAKDVSRAELRESARKVDEMDRCLRIAHE